MECRWALKSTNLCVANRIYAVVEELSDW